jgi:hypothetical protein
MLHKQIVYRNKNTINRLRYTYWDEIYDIDFKCFNRYKGIYYYTVEI